VVALVLPRTSTGVVNQVRDSRRGSPRARALNIVDAGDVAWRDCRSRRRLGHRRGLFLPPKNVRRVPAGLARGFRFRARWRSA